MPEATSSPPAPPPELARGAALFLDFDGTLVDLALTPDAVAVDDRVTQVLTKLSRSLDGRIAIVSGRPVAALRELLPLSMHMVGSHGMEFATANGAVDVAVRPEALSDVLARMKHLAGEGQGLIVEDKPLGVALHYRQAPDVEEVCLDLASALAAEHGLHLQPGKMMIEVRSPGGDKGSAIERLMREPEMRGARPVFMGDDLTDEPGFASAARLGGAGILVGDERPTSALYRVDGVEAAIAWLEAAAVQLP